MTRDVVIDVEAKQHDFPWDKNFMNLLLQADDGPMYLNILARIPIELKQMVQEKDPSRQDLMKNPRYASFDIMREEIQDQFDESIDNPKIFEKVQWFAAYWNRVIPGNIMPLITGPGVAPRAFR